MIRLDGKSSGNHPFEHMASKNIKILDFLRKAITGPKTSFYDALFINGLPSGSITEIAMMNAYLRTALHLKRL